MNQAHWNQLRQAVKVNGTAAAKKAVATVEAKAKSTAKELEKRR